jgi:hypothetical protein
MAYHNAHIVVGVSLRSDQLRQLQKRLRRGDRSRLIQLLIDKFLNGEIDAIYQRKLG